MLTGGKVEGCVQREQQEGGDQEEQEAPAVSMTPRYLCSCTFSIITMFIVTEERGGEVSSKVNNHLFGFL